MKKGGIILSILIVLLVIAAALVFVGKQRDDDSFISYKVNLQRQTLKLYWRDSRSSNFGSIQKLKLWLDTNKLTLVFAMNGGMYKKDGSPQGLYIENKRELSPIDTSSGSGNFYMAPNGVFCISERNIAAIFTTADFKNHANIKYATQSGPMLVINGQIHSLFKAGSTNLNIRNGVGILPSGEIVFAMSKKPVNFYNFAAYFKAKGCKNALYLDGFVSRVYLPEKKWMQTDGNFGVIIGVTEPR